LGNHDLHLIGCALGARPFRPRDTFDDVLRAPDRDELIEWLRQRPLLHREGELVMVHAGLHPCWSVERAAQLAEGVSSHLRGPRAGEFAGRLRELERVSWREDFSPEQQVEHAAAILVSIRTCRADGELCDHDGPVAAAPPECRAWFERWQPWPSGVRVVFGHWSALGLSLGSHHFCLDTGCVWGRTLTALRLDDLSVFSQPSVETYGSV
jgi:bis(5'-nucleosyl)-tetraphosphatase (symmetrical)